ncbi:5-formyltetrahydrofolate cyclo-ligase [Tistrella bauzanensis]|uniref:5-formyltetrahydrofolate cyclo-ligase n=1 Tax=Tistrella bauzanensis TaxID=657419 RepID=UPI001E353AD1|nr:5-formyltetrahydrofolate cyclo-ligase [Tistrella bauzanensis]
MRSHDLTQPIAPDPDVALAALKGVLRRELRRVRREASAARGFEAASALAAQAGTLADALADIVPARSQSARPRIVAGYVAAGGEIDVLPLMRALAGRLGAAMALPVVNAPDMPLDFRAWRPEMALTIGAFGIPIPAAGPTVMPDLLLMPLVAVDRGGHRLGQGGGFYDRTIARAEAAGLPPVTVGVAFAEQVVDAVPRGMFDRPLDLVLTDRGLMRPDRS